MTISPSNASEPYRDPRLPVAERVQDLLSRMTLEEKCAQLGAVYQRMMPISDERGAFLPEKADEVLRHGMGEISRPSEIDRRPNAAPRSRDLPVYVEFVNDTQRFLVEKTRLGIPAMFHEEALHGLAVPGATIFPTPLGLASSWDPDLVERVMAVAAREARARGIAHVLAPVLDIARDPRWGRTEETFGEDPYLVTQLGIAAIRGYQGYGQTLGQERAYVTLKHFALHGPCEGGINAAPASVGERLLREVYLRPFQAAVAEAKPMAIMASYNEIDGVPAHANRWLFETVLRKEWGFDGLVVSDYDGISHLRSRHAVAGTLEEAARLALQTGIDLELPAADAYRTLADQVRSGAVSEGVIDQAVARMLRAKFQAGLFENPYADLARAETVTHAPDHQAVALEAAQRAIVLLKNEGGLLPLDRKKIQSIAVIGPNAKGVHLGGYAGPDDHHGVDVFEGIEQKLGSDAAVLYAEGCRITQGVSDWWRDRVIAVDPAENRERIAHAVAVARHADAAIVVVGSNEETSREAWDDAHLGDVSDLRLPAEQDELVAAIAATGTPTVVVLLNGRPYAIPEIARTVPAILEGWYLGEQGGQAVADVLFGDVNPSGKLPISMPRSVGHLPVHYSRKATSLRSYLFGEREALFRFGFGLSFTTFVLDDVILEREHIRLGQSTRVFVDVTNTGTRRGEEVVQLYIRDRVSSVTRPVKELKGFSRVALDPGEMRTIALEILPDHLAFYDADMAFRVEPGEFDILVGTSSRDEDLTTVKLVVTAEDPHPLLGLSTRPSQGGEAKSVSTPSPMPEPAAPQNVPAVAEDSAPLSGTADSHPLSGTADSHPLSGTADSHPSTATVVSHSSSEIADSAPSLATVVSHSSSEIAVPATNGEAPAPPVGTASHGAASSSAMDLFDSIFGTTKGPAARSDEPAGALDRAISEGAAKQPDLAREERPEPASAVTTAAEGEPADPPSKDRPSAEPTQEGGASSQHD